MTNRSKRGFLALAPKRWPLGKSVGDKHCLSWPGLSSGIDVRALSLQLKPLVQIQDFTLHLRYYLYPPFTGYQHLLCWSSQFYTIPPD